LSLVRTYVDVVNEPELKAKGEFYEVRQSKITYIKEIQRTWQERKLLQVTGR
jgi:hypothetical protein